MIKKVILLLTMPTVLFIYLESCNKGCEHMETRNIVAINTQKDSEQNDNQNIIRMNLNYESYFAANFQFNLTNKTFGLTQVRDHCFNELINPIDSVSIISKQDFNSSFPANSQINALFTETTLRIKMDRFYYNVYPDRDYPDVEFVTSFSFINDSLPTLDSIHDLEITVFCQNGDVFKDSLIGINLKSKL